MLLNHPSHSNVKVKSFMKARAKNIVIAGISMASLFGIISAGVLIFKPDELSNIQQSLKAKAATEYRLPNSNSNSVTTNTDLAFLKSFSKVFSNIAKETRPALVLIVSQKKIAIQQTNIPDDFFFPFLPPEFRGPNGNERGQKGQQGVETDAGSGFIVDIKNGYIITNNHVIDGADKITVTTYDNQKYQAKVIGSAKNLDIAVLKLEKFNGNNNLKQLSLADSDKVEVGDWVVALGAPFELQQTVTMGIVSAVKRSGDVLGLNGPNSFIQTDAPINPGNSGGPLVNLEGHVVGMNTAIYSKNGTNVGIGFSIPANTIRMVADSLINNGKLMQSYLGVEMYDAGKFGESALKEMNINPNAEGGLIMRVVPNSPAAHAGLQPYDVIQSINENPVKSPSDISGQIILLKPGTSIKIGVLRNEKSITLTAILAEMPSTHKKAENREDSEKSISNVDILSDKYGIHLAEQKSKNISVGVSIALVDNGSIADAAGLQAGDVLIQINRKTINSKTEAETLMKKIIADAKKKSISRIFLTVEKADGPKGGGQTIVILPLQ